MARVKVYDDKGRPHKVGMGLFARVFMEHFPLLPVEEESRLHDPKLRENFIERVFCYRRFQDLVQNGVTKQGLIRFHTIHKYLLLAHSQQHYQGATRGAGDARAGGRARPSRRPRHRAG